MQTISQKLYARMLTTFSREDGQAMAEYGVILALIAAVCVVVLGVLGGQVQKAFDTVSKALPGA